MQAARRGFISPTEICDQHLVATQSSKPDFALGVLYLYQIRLLPDSHAAILPTSKCQRKPMAKTHALKQGDTLNKESL
jgi:hypothetical protein